MSRLRYDNMAKQVKMMMMSENMNEKDINDSVMLDFSMTYLRYSVTF